MHAVRVIELVIRASAGRHARNVARKEPKVIDGTLAALPRVGESIVIFREDKMNRLITSNVIRILSDCDGSLYAETRNSVYRIELTAGRVARGRI